MAGRFGSVLASTWEGREVAIKALKAANPGIDQLSRLLREGEVIRSLRHAHVVEVLGVCRDEGTIRVVMERVDGGSLVDWLGSTLRTSGSSAADRLTVGKKCVGFNTSE